MNILPALLLRSHRKQTPLKTKTLHCSTDVKEAKRPLFYAGGTIISEASREVTELAHRIDAPVCDSLMGNGRIFRRRSSVHRNAWNAWDKNFQSWCLGCDLLIVLGARFSDRVTGNTKTFAKNAKILQIDVDAAEINKNIVVDASVVGDEKEVLKRILAEVPEMRHSEWTAHISELKEKYPLRYDHSQLTGPYIIEKLYELTKGDAIITTEVGQNQMVGSSVFQIQRAKNLPFFRWPGNYGIWSWSSHRSQDGKTGQDCGKYRR